MKIRELMSSPVHTCRADESLAAAAQRMWQHDCGVLPVVDRDGKLTAMITDRDACIGAWLRGAVMHELPISGSMSKALVSCRADDDVAAAADAMAKHQVHRLPVVDGQGKLVGLVSLNDLAVAAEQDTAIARIAMRVLTAVCRRREAAAATPPRPLSTILLPGTPPTAAMPAPSTSASAPARS